MPDTPRSRLSTFVVGTANRMAATAARAVVEAPGAVYNPLFVYGASGVGKTHLLDAIADEIAARHPDFVLERLGMEEFMEELRAASATGRSVPFKGRFQKADVLLLDDVQMLGGRVDGQSEVLRIVNAMQASGRQIVMAADRPPTELRELDARLLNRLSGGLVVEIQPPDVEMREAIVRQLARQREVIFGAAVLETLARSVVGNVRELQGALNRLYALQEAEGRLLVPQDVWGALGTLRVPSTPDEFTSFLEDVATSVAASVESWRTTLAERIAVWSGQGFRTGILEHALELDEPPNVEELDASFRVVTERLTELEREAIRCDPRHAGLPLFRDPDRLHEAEAFVAAAVARSTPPAAPDPRWRLQDFPRTAMNRPALAAAQQLILTPARVAHLLCIVGPARSGKTHLVHGIGNGLRVADPDAVVACLKAEEVGSAVAKAVAAGTIDAWQARHRMVQALLVEDLQHLDGRARVQQELAALLDAVRTAGRPVVVSSDREWTSFQALSSALRAVLDSGVRVQTSASSHADLAGRFTPVPDGDEAAAPNIDVSEVVHVSSRVRPASSNVVDVAFLDPEKVIHRWPDVSAFLIDEVA